MSRRPSRLSDAASPDTPQSRIPRRAPTGGSVTPLAPTQETAERVKVVVRVRPPHPHETGGGLALENDGRTICLQRNRNANVAQSDFEFDQVLSPEANQADVYEAAVRPIVEDVLKGYNGTIMAYGQTGAGKTYTLSSVQSADNIGMMPRAAAHLFSEIAADSTHIYNVLMGYVQIYMELIQDLLQPENENLQIREGNSGVFVAGNQEQPVRSMADCLRLMQLGDQNRRVAFTQLNATSSRSHAIIMLTVIKRRRSASQNPDQQKMKVGKLFIVDLAGSERLKKSQSTGQRASEAKAINLSLTTLGICINARADPNSKHVPFRDSKLTRLLQESLGGNTKTSLVVAVANAVEHTDETLQSLQFGSRAMRVQTKAVVNESLGGKLLTSELLASLSQLEIQPCLVDASLLAKEEELERIQEALQGERDKASKIIAALQAEQESQRADQARQMGEIEAKISEQKQEVQQQESLLQRAKENAAAAAEHHREEVRRLEADLRGAQESYQRLEEKLEDAGRAAARKLDAMKKEHEATTEALQQRHAEAQSRDAFAHRAALSNLERRLEAAAEQRRQLEEAAQQQAEAAELRKAELQAEWEARLGEVEAAAEQRVHHERGLSQARLDEAQQCAEREAAAAADLSKQLDTLQQQHASLADDHSASVAEVAALRTVVEGMEKAAAGTEAQLTETRAQLAALERSNGQYQTLYMNNKRLNDAARTIQRRYKLWRMRALKDQSCRDAQALVLAHRDKSSLEGQKAVMQRDQHRHLVWSGKALVAASLAAVEEAVAQIRTAFLVPSKELKTLGHLKNRISKSPGLSGSPKAAHLTPSPLSRNLSFVSETSGSAPSFPGRLASTDATPPLPGLAPRMSKQPTPPKVVAFGEGIQAHWGTPTR